MDQISDSLRPTRFLNSDNPDIIAFQERHAGQGGTKERAVRLYQAVRDAVPYSLYAFRIEPETLVASNVLHATSSYCVPKAVLFAAVARAAGIPARIGFANVRNHLSNPRIEALMQDDLFRWHAYTVLYLDGQWVKATPAFDAAFCERYDILPLEFDGATDSIFHPFDAQGRKHMEYVDFIGEFDDLPYDRFAAEMTRAYPEMLAELARQRRHADAIAKMRQ